MKLLNFAFRKSDFQRIFQGFWINGYLRIKSEVIWTLWTANLVNAWSLLNEMIIICSLDVWILLLLVLDVGHILVVFTGIKISGTIEIHKLSFLRSIRALGHGTDQTELAMASVGVRIFHLKVVGGHFRYCNGPELKSILKI